MIAARGHVELAFLEPDLQTTTPQCVPFIAGAIAWGWKLAQDGHCNLVDSYSGATHLQDFRKMPKRGCRRIIQCRFRSAALLVLTEPGMTLQMFHKRCLEDSIFFRHCLRHPRYARKREQLLSWFAEQRRHIDVSDKLSHDRRLIVPCHGGAPDLIAKLATQYEGGLR